MQWSKDYATSDPSPLGGGRGERRIAAKHKEAAVSASAAISPGAADGAEPVESVSAPNCLSRGKLLSFCIASVSFGGSDPT